MRTNPITGFSHKKGGRPMKWSWMFLVVGLVACVPVASGQGFQPMGPPMGPYAYAPVASPIPVMPGVAPVMPVAAWTGGQPLEPVPADQAGLEGECDTCAEEPCCCRQLVMFGDFIYLRPRNQEVAFAVPANGAIPANPTAVQVGPTAVADFDYEPGFRLGGSMPFGECSLLRSVGTWYEADTNASIRTFAPLVIEPMVNHPSIDLADRTFLAARARYLVDFELLDVDWVRVLSYGDFHQVDLVLGARYASMTEEFRSYFIANDFDTISSNIAFAGGGIRVGLEGEWYDTSRCWLVYARSAASFVAGDFRTEYAQDNNLGQRVVVTTWRAGRVVTMLDLEIGFGWNSADGAYRLTAGYMFSGWHNTVNTAQFIDAVQTNEYAGLGDMMTFDGFVARAEFRF